MEEEINRVTLEIPIEVNMAMIGKHSVVGRVKLHVLTAEAKCTDQKQWRKSVYKWIQPKNLSASDSEEIRDYQSDYHKDNLKGKNREEIRITDGK